MHERLRAVARRAGKVVLQLYRETEGDVQRRIERWGPTTCTEGCAHCCRLMAITTVPEMIPVVEYLVAQPDWETRRPELERRTIEYLQALVEVGLSDDPDDPARLAWWKKQIACPLLENERCSAYAARPSVCRFHYAVTPATECRVRLDRDEQPIIGRIDLRDIELTIAVISAKEAGLLTHGSIPACFVMACRLLGVRFDVPDGLAARGMIAVSMLEEDQ